MQILAHLTIYHFFSTRIFEMIRFTESHIPVTQSIPLHISLSRCVFRLTQFQQNQIRHQQQQDKSFSGECMPI